MLCPLPHFSPHRQFQILLRLPRLIVFHLLPYFWPLWLTSIQDTIHKPLIKVLFLWQMCATIWTVKNTQKKNKETKIKTTNSGALQDWTIDLRLNHFSNPRKRERQRERDLQMLWKRRMMLRLAISRERNSSDVRTFFSSGCDAAARQQKKSGCLTRMEL